MVIVAKFTPQDAQRYARAFASKNNNSQKSQESQKTETESPNNKSQDRKDNQTAIKVNLEPEDTEHQAEIAQLQSQNQNQYDITGTDMTLRPCAMGELRRAAGAPTPLDTPPLPRISDGGEEGEGSAVERTRDIRQGIGDSQLNDAGRRAITISTILAGNGVKVKATASGERVGPSPQEEKEMSPEEEQQCSIVDDLVRRSALHALIPEPPGGTSTEAIGIPASCDASPAQGSVLSQGEKPRMHSLEELTEKLLEEPRVGSVDQQKENIEDLSSVIITTTSEELREIDTGPDLDLGALDQMHDLNDFNGIMDDINLTTIDDAEGINFPESGRDQSSYLPDSSWGPIFGTTMWNNIAMGTITDFVVGHENLAGLLPTRSGRGLGRGSDTVDIQGKFKEEEQSFLSTSTESFDFEELPPSLQEEQLLLADSIPPASQEEQPGITSHDFKSMEKTESGAAGTLAQEELCAPTRTPDDSNIENYNNYHCSIVSDMTIDAAVGEGDVDGNPLTRSEYDQVDTGEAATITKVLAGTTVKKKDDTVIVATEGDTHGKIIGYNCGYYYDCDYWDEYDIRDKNMEIEPGTRMPSASYLSPCKALLRAGDFVFTGQPPGG